MDADCPIMAIVGPMMPAGSVRTSRQTGSDELDRYYRKSLH